MTTEEQAQQDALRELQQLKQSAPPHLLRRVMAMVRDTGIIFGSDPEALEHAWPTIQRMTERGLSIDKESGK